MLPLVSGRWSCCVDEHFSFCSLGWLSLGCYYYTKAGFIQTTKNKQPLLCEATITGARSLPASIVCHFFYKETPVYIYIYVPRFDIGVYIYIYTHDYNSAGTCLCFYCQNKFIKKKHRNVSTQSKYMVYTCYNGDILQLKQPQLISGNATWPAFHLRISIVSEWPSLFSFCR